MNNKIYYYIKSQKKFLNKKELGKIKLEIHNLIIKNINQKKNRLNYKKFYLNKFNKDYEIAKKNGSWKNIYNKLKNLKSIKSIIIPKVLKLSQRILMKKTKIINKGIRIIEKSDKRNYPIHQEYLDIKSKNFLVFWIALHKVPISQGGLLISKKIPNKKLPHYRNKMNYPILNQQKFWKKNSYEKKFLQGELLILGKYIPHGTAPKKYGAPRWACVVRAGL